MRRAVLAGLLLSIATVGEASAWNSRGHMIVAAIAWDKLTPEARAKVSALVKLNPHYGKWTSGVASANRDKYAFMKAATWADEIKSETGYSDTLAPGTPPNAAYDDKARHKDWHYKDLPFSKDGTPTTPASDPNALTQITAYVAALADPSITEAQKSYDLVWLLHLVGDVHQPLHATSRFTATDTNGDAGGNDVDVCLVNCSSGKTKLHAFWDGALGGSVSALSAATKASALQPALPGKAANIDPQAWLNESLSLAKAKAYGPPVGPAKGPYQLTQAYKNAAGSTAEKQVALAGARLATIINNALH